MASPVQVAAQNDRGAETADLIETVVLDLTSWAHLLTARQPRCDHCSALTKAPRPNQLRDKKIPSPSRGANIWNLNAPSSPSAGRFQFPAPRQSPANGFLLASPSVTSYRHCAPIWFTPYVQPPSYRTVVRLRKARPAGRTAGRDSKTQAGARGGLRAPLKSAATIVSRVA